MKTLKPVVFVVGTTASGKSQWALDMAKQVSGSIINCDSVQLYKSLNIGAAKPTTEEMVQAPHYLYDYVSAGESMTAGNYTRDFFTCMDKLPMEKPAFVVGGTGFYFQAIEKGMYPVRQTPPEIQKEIADILTTEEGAKKLFEEFQRFDPEAAQKIHPQDHYRLGRAMELIRAEGKSLTQIQKEFADTQAPFPYPLLKIGLRWDREVLKERVKLRTQKMLDAGLIQEVKDLVARGYGEWSALQSVGYKEVLEYLRDGKSEQWLFDEIVQNTMGLAKRQRTWFQRDPNIHWYDGATGFDEAMDRVHKFLEEV
ncbi:tRNA (adenosine(37)-N6)-dimethylallyltransferase MiaA [Bdellovibrio sp. HCB337]|uniref:tRNA (adenosine(37)-N6)-dimethylallyltransferase MiaA n=1 Tax=Bdellovibrio sp. HCB337 TaxID=3394358 RepID=UPI0039A5C128